MYINQPSNSSLKAECIVGLVHRHFWRLLLHLFLPSFQDILQQLNLHVYNGKSKSMYTIGTAL